MAEVRTIDDRKINWAKPPRPNAKVLWSKRASNGKRVTGSLRHIAHLDRLNNLALMRYKTEIVIIQPAFNSSVRASAGTHDLDATVDLWIPGVSWWEQQRFCRANGLGSWYRHPPAFGNHIHGFTLPPREGVSISDDFRVHGFTVGKFVDGGHSIYGRQVTSSQIEDYYDHAFGLSGQHRAGSDRSWFPADIAKTIFDLDRYIARRVP